MKTIETEIKNVQKYFTDKILSDEFDVIKIGEHVMEILIDDQYKFVIWIANGPENRHPYHSAGYEYFIHLDFTQKQCLKCHSVLKRRIDEYKNGVLIEEKKRQFEKLKTELGL